MSFGGAIKFKLNYRGYMLLGFALFLLIYFNYLQKVDTHDDPLISLSYLLQTAIQAAEAGGKLVVSVRNELKIESKGKTKEGMDDSVTTADFLSHCAMKHIIVERFPNVKFISEETNTPCDKEKLYEYPKNPIHDQMPNDFIKSSDVTMWIDPLDATHEYTEKLYQYVTTMVCVAIKGKPIIGVIHYPFSKSTSWAVVGYNHSVDLDKPQKATKKTKVIISRSHSGHIQEILAKNFKDTQVEIAAGAGYKVLKVADGSVDAYLHITAIKKWDICAGNAILNALGGTMTTKYGSHLTYFNDSDVVNKDGLIATLRNHEIFVNKL